MTNILPILLAARYPETFDAEPVVLDPAGDSQLNYLLEVLDPNVISQLAEITTFVEPEPLGSLLFETTEWGLGMILSGDLSEWIGVERLGLEEVDDLSGFVFAPSIDESMYYVYPDDQSEELSVLVLAPAQRGPSRVALGIGDTGVRIGAGRDVQFQRPKNKPKPCELVYELVDGRAYPACDPVTCQMQCQLRTGTQGRTGRKIAIDCRCY
jgi:hypothetical protein